MPNNKWSSMDPDQIHRATHDEELNAQRVTLVGLDSLVVEPKIDLTPLIEQMKEYYKNSQQPVITPSSQLQIMETKVPVHTVETKIERIEVPTVIVQEKHVEVPQERIILQEKIQIIEVPTPIHTVETRIERIEVPTVIVQERIVEVPCERLIFQDRVQKVEVPVLTKEVEYREIKIPVITERLRDDKVLKIFQVIQSLAVLGILIKLLTK